jgi:aconitate hydratase
VALLSAAGIAAIRLDDAAVKGLKGQRTIALPAPSTWPERQATTVTVGAVRLPLTWLALGAERAWATGVAPHGSSAGGRGAERGERGERGEREKSAPLGATAKGGGRSIAD